MPIAVSGSIATDHLMHFPGRFADSLLPDQLHRVSLSFLVDDLVVRRGGVAPNICFGMAKLGLQPGPGRRGRRRLRRLRELADPARRRLHHGAPVLGRADRPVRLHHRRRDEPDRVVLRRRDGQGPGDRARADRRRAYGGARPGGDRRGRPGRRWSGTPRSAGSAATRSRPTRRSSSPGWTAPTSPSLITGASLLFTNDYELGLLQSKTGWTEDEILRPVGYRVTTLGSKGVEIVAADGSTADRAGALPETSKTDPTGVGDAFRAGFLAGRAVGPVASSGRPSSGR